MLKWTGRALLLALLIGGVAGLKKGWEKLKASPEFKIVRIEVSGNRRASEEEVLYLSKLKPGMGILDFRLSSVVASVEDHPWVRKAQVSRELPDRVLIRVWEEEPAAILIWEEAYYLDSGLRVFKKLIPGDEINYPIITGVALEKIENRDETSLAALQDALTVWKLARRSRLFPAEEVAELHMDPALGLDIITSSGPRVAFGEGLFEEKFRKLERVRVEMGEQFYMLKGLDLSQSDRVVARFYRKEAEPVAEAGLTAPAPSPAEKE